MKKILTFIIFILIIVASIVIFTYGNEILTLLDEKKVYTVENIRTTEIETLDEYRFFEHGVLTYNNQKIVFLDYNNKIIWNYEDGSFSNKVYVTDNYIFRAMDDTIQVLDKNNQKFLLAEIQGNIVNVSRENDKTYLIVKGNNVQDLLYIMDGNNEIVVDGKIFDERITGISISDKSEGYTLITLRFENGSIVNTLYFNLIDDIELWKTEIEKEILIGTRFVNNNVIAIGTNNIYYFNSNGKLMWKNGIYYKLLDYDISKQNQSIYILYNQNDGIELISYNFEGKVTGLTKIPVRLAKLKIYGDRVFVYNESSIYLIHGQKFDKIYENSDINIADFVVEGSDITILSKDKLVKGQIK